MINEQDIINKQIRRGITISRDNITGLFLDTTVNRNDYEQITVDAKKLKILLDAALRLKDAIGILTEEEVRDIDWLNRVTLHIPKNPELKAKNYPLLISVSGAKNLFFALAPIVEEGDE